ncbi:hypothetical protein [endosymbiont of Ridgeia piscesae]|jgi:hypothetical protein|uniref:Uncharacterized protein n=1 Tax=endosymbiont of Ridgeia piscesae TaxID=54398 RepID=A0A0T5YZE4_9GAMM|nr:hypothetical protein [endosymbiont of Ridgeia piscesae]KRT55994.1 hypothetical protein Ga0074115_12915 [endosymbiont of Ridgeia piscesae]KRT56989.1 hypothetical protein Ga0076813_107510 [endosymbiont of Ridgeia piscesae]
MARNNEFDPPLSDQALELIMRDVLDSLQDTSLQSAFSANPFPVEIISIEKVPHPCHEPHSTASDSTAEIIYPACFRKIAV